MVDYQIFDRPEVLRVLFHPRRDNSTPRGGVHSIAVEVEPGIKVGGRLYPTNGPTAPAILFFHGNGEIAADYDYIAPLFGQLGVNLLVIDYRGYGSSDGTPTVSNTVKDAVTVFAALGGIFNSHGLFPEQVYVMGRSLGSVSAIEITLQAGDKLAGLIIESGFADTLGLLGRLGFPVTGLDPEMDKIGNGSKMTQIKTKTLIIHGEEDSLIPAAQGEKLYHNCAASSKQLVLIPSAGHNDLLMVGTKQYLGAIKSFID
ncbi:MAG: alpha/beta fold hydrolase [Hormoscilla sp. GUM202]|nr:alpha/beta fold hydrolase [Hormoscilla sp. GUM202]